MKGKRPFKSISVSNILSFGPDGVNIDLEPLNVLVGPNGSGKSNFLEVFRLLQSTPHDLVEHIVGSGGLGAWQWSGPENGESTIKSQTELIDWNENPWDDITYVHELTISPRSHIYLHESIRKCLKGREDVMYDGPIRPKMMAYNSVTEVYEPRVIKADGLKRDQSILSQRNDPDAFGYISALSEFYANSRIYGSVILGPSTPARLQQKADLDGSFLFEDGSNLALVLNDLQNRPDAINAIVEYLKLFSPRIENFVTRVSYGLVQVYMHEKGLANTVPATRLSDGTIRFLALLTILCHPTPPPLICVEEPELGMHPDIIPTIGDLLIEASNRTQLIVTTHSDLLLSRFQDLPEAVLVCERAENGTTMHRPDPDMLSERLRDKSLGEIWLQGAIGGTRW